MMAEKAASRVGTIEVEFRRPGTEDVGLVVFQGGPEFLAKGACAISYVISFLGAAYGVGRENWIDAGNELNAALEAISRGEGFQGQIVKVTLEK
jgi:hypothetical protein